MIIISVISFIISIITAICFFVLCYNVYLIRRQTAINSKNFKRKFYLLINLNEIEKAKELLYNEILTNNNLFKTEYAVDFDSISKEVINNVFKIYKKQFEILGINKPE